MSASSLGRYLIVVTGDFDEGDWVGVPTDNHARALRARTVARRYARLNAAGRGAQHEDDTVQLTGACDVYGGQITGADVFVRIDEPPS